MTQTTKICFRICLFLVSLWLIAQSQAAESRCKGQVLLDGGYVWSDLVFRGEVKFVGECPHCASGPFAESAQFVEYRVLRIFKGTLPNENVRIAHHIVNGADLIATNTPCLREEIFHENADLIVFARWDYQQERFEIYHPSYGVVPSNVTAVKHLARISDECVTGIPYRINSTNRKFHKQEQLVSVSSHNQGNNKSSICISGRSARYHRKLWQCLFGSEATETTTSIAPKGMWTATEVSNGYSSDVLIGSTETVCPPRLLTSRGVKLQDGNIAKAHAGAASVIWLDGSRLIFIDSPESFQARNQVYVYSAAKGIVKGLAVPGKPQRLYEEGGQLLCAVENEDSGETETVVLAIDRSGDDDRKR